MKVTRSKNMSHKRQIERAINESTDEMIEALARRITSGARVLFITGAGLSVPSGIAAYRCESKSEQKTAIWNRFVMSWGTMQMFRKDPLVWYNSFWLQTHQRPEYDRALPNAGHHAIANLSNIVNTRCITQNVDRLHRRTHLNYNRLIEVHGALGLYRCSSAQINAKTGELCPYVHDRPIEGIEISDLDPVEGTSYEKGNLQIKRVPCCPECGSAAVPLALLFDELYSSHTFFDWDRALEWMDHCDVMIFVGTSLSVGVTTECIDIARNNGVSLYNFNIKLEKEAMAINDLYHVIGNSVETLRSLYRHCLYRYYHPYQQVKQVSYARKPMLTLADEEDKKAKEYRQPMRRMRLYYPPQNGVLKVV